MTGDFDVDTDDFEVDVEDDPDIFELDIGGEEGDEEDEDDG